MKEKILMLCYRRPYPVISGAEIRMFQFIEVLAEYYRVDVLYLDESHDEPDLSGLTQKTGFALPFRVSKFRRLAQSAFAYVFDNKPLQIGYFHSVSMQKWINAHAKEYPMILCMHVRTVEYALQAKRKGKLSPDCKLYLDGIDAISMHYLHTYQISKGIKKIINGMEYRRMKQYEKTAFETVDRSTLISERDREYIVDELKADCSPRLIYNYAIDFGYNPQITQKPYTLFFMGKMNYQPNVDAITHFVPAVYDRLKADFPALQFHIAGGYATDEIKKLQSHDGVRVCGFIDNPSEEMQRATLVVAPMISGSGLQNKIVQAMYLGCPVVTTTIGADGLADVRKEELLVAEDDEQLYQILKTYLAPDKEAERRLIGNRAREYIMTHYSYSNVKKQIEEAFSINTKDV